MFDNLKKDGWLVQSPFLYNTMNQKQILTKYYNHQEHTYCYLGSFKNIQYLNKIKRNKSPN